MPTTPIPVCITPPVPLRPLSLTPTRSQHLPCRRPALKTRHIAPARRCMIATSMVNDYRVRHYEYTFAVPRPLSAACRVEREGRPARGFGGRHRGSVHGLPDARQAATRGLGTRELRCLQVRSWLTHGYVLVALVGFSCAGGYKKQNGDFFLSKPSSASVLVLLESLLRRVETDVCFVAVLFFLLLLWSCAGLCGKTNDYCALRLPGWRVCNSCFKPAHKPFFIARMGVDQPQGQAYPSNCRTRSSPSWRHAQTWARNIGRNVCERFNEPVGRTVRPI